MHFSNILLTFTVLQKSRVRLQSTDLRLNNQHDQLNDILNGIRNLPLEQREERLLMIASIMLGVMQRPEIERMRDQLIRRGMHDESALALIDGQLALRDLRGSDQPLLPASSSGA